MEHFPLHQPCLLDSLPPLASVGTFGDASIVGVALLSKPRKGYLTFCDRLSAGTPEDAECTSTMLVPKALLEQMSARYPSATLVPLDDARAAFIDTLEYLRQSGMLGLTSLLPNPPTIAPDARIGERVVIESGVQIDSGVTVGDGSVVRRGTWLQRGAAVGENCVIGSVGIDAYVGQDGKRRRFPHVAGVIVGDGVSLGANCVVVRGILSSTQIGAGSILGNLCNIGHGVEVGENAWISAGTMVGGHTTIGGGATIALGCAIRDNISIGARANVGMGSVVTKNVRAGQSVFGNPARTFRSINAGPLR